MEKYYKYRVEYNDYIILYKVGTFFHTYDNDALIINDLFDYKINNKNGLLMVGFPIGIIKNITNVLDLKHINYITIVDDNIINNHLYKDNTYDKYEFNIDEIKYNFKRVDIITKYLNNNILNISNIIPKIEELIGR